MIKQYRLEIEQEGQRIPGFWAYWLYAWLLEQVPAQVGDEMHEQGETPLAQYIVTDRETQRCFWVVSLLGEHACAVFAPVLDEVQEICVQGGRIQIKERSVRTVEENAQWILRERQEQERRARMEISFCSVTAFKHDGRYEVFPSVHLIVQSLIAKWNETFPEFSMQDEDAVNALERSLYITDYSLHSSRFQLKNARIPGFLGTIQVESRLPAPLEELWQSLLAFAECSGVGIKTTLGMGGVRVRAVPFPGERQ